MFKKYNPYDSINNTLHWKYNCVGKSFEIIVPVCDMYSNANKILRLYNKYNSKTNNYHNDIKLQNNLRKKYDFLLGLYSSNLLYSFDKKQTYDIDTLDSLIAVDFSESIFAQPLMFSIFKNRIRQSPENIEVYKKFIGYMDIYGMDSEEDKLKLKSAISQLNLKEAYKITMQAKPLWDLDEVNREEINPY